MSKYKEHIYLTMLRKRGNYISHHLDKMEEGPLKALRDKPLDSSLRQIKSIFGVYQILLLEIVNDLKFSQLEQFALGIQKLFKQVIAASLHFVKGLLKSIQKNYQGTKEKDTYPDKHLTAEEEMVERRIYEFKEKFYFNLQEEAKAEINSEDPQDQALEKLHQEIQIAKEGILNKQTNEASVSNYLKEIMQHFNKSCYGSKLILQNAQNQLKQSDIQLKQTQQMHNLLERAVFEKQKKMRIIRKTLMTNEIAVRKPTVNDFTQTDQMTCKCQIGISKQQKKALKRVSHNKQYTQTSQESQFEHNKTIIQNHELTQQLIQTNKRIEMLSSKALELKEMIDDKNQEIEYLHQIITKLENPDEYEADQNKKESIKQSVNGKVIKTFKAKRQRIDFRRKFAKSNFNQTDSIKNKSIDNQIEVVEELLESIDTGEKLQQIILKAREQFSQSKFSFIWEIVYDIVIVNRLQISKSEFVQTVQEQIAKNKVMMKQIPKTHDIKTKAVSTPKNKYSKIGNKSQFTAKQTPQFDFKLSASLPKTAQPRKRVVLRNSLNVIKQQPRIFAKQTRVKSSERYRARPQSQARKQPFIKQPINQNQFGPGFKMMETENVNSQTFTQLTSNRSPLKINKHSKSNTNYIRIKPKTLQLQFEQDKYIITLYRRYAEFRITQPQPCFRIMNELGLTQIYNRGFITFDQFSLQASRYIDKHRNCLSRGDGIICSHLVNLANVE